MTLSAIKNKLHEYIDHADEKKLKAIYTMIESDIERINNVYDDIALSAFRNTSADYSLGKVKGYSMQESLKRIRKQLTEK